MPDTLFVAVDGCLYRVDYGRDGLAVRPLAGEGRPAGPPALELVDGAVILPPGPYRELLSDAAFWRRLDSGRRVALAALARKAAAELRSTREGSAALAAAYALQFLALAARARAAWEPPEGVWTVEDARRYVDQRYAERFSVEFFVTRCAMNAADFSRRFKESAGYPLFEYINRQRIRRACALLKSSDEPIIDVALAVGYNNVSFFNRYFSRIMGQNPRTYRRSGRA